MSLLIGWGALLPASLLSSGWFQVLAAFVAVNTSVYAVLSVSKLIPKRGTSGRNQARISPSRRALRARRRQHRPASR